MENQKMVNKGIVRRTTGVLLVFNLLGMLYGLSLVIYGSWVLITQMSFINLTKIVEPPYGNLEEVFAKSSVLQQSYYLLVSSAIIAFFCYILGFLGTWQRKPIYLIFFIVTLIVLIGLEGAASLLAFIHTYQVKHYVNGFLYETVFPYNSQLNHTKNSWNQMMNKLKCCGINNYSDIIPLNGINGILPAACCESDHLLSSNKECYPNSNNLFPDGCAIQLENWLCYYLITLTEVILAMVILQIITLIVTFTYSYLLKQEKTNKREEYRQSIASTQTVESTFKTIESK